MSSDEKDVVKQHFATLFDHRPDDIIYVHLPVLQLTVRYVCNVTATDHRPQAILPIGRGREGGGRGEGEGGHGTSFTRLRTISSGLDHFSRHGHISIDPNHFPQTSLSFHGT